MLKTDRGEHEGSDDAGHQQPVLDGRGTAIAILVPAGGPVVIVAPAEPEPADFSKPVSGAVRHRTLRTLRSGIA